MSLEPRADDGVPEVTARVVRAAFPKGTLAIRIREALGPLFADEDFAAAFPGAAAPRRRRVPWRWCRCSSSRRACRTGRPLTR